MRAASVTRRAFLRALGLLGLAAPLLSMTGCGAGDGKSGSTGGTGSDPNKVDAFKLSARGLKACKACRAHARNKIFATAIIADAHRAHSGCDCKIKLVRISKADAQRYFADFPYHDRRSTG